MQKKHIWSTLVLLLMVVLAAGSTDSDGTGSTRSKKIEAWVMAQQFVEDKLKSPSSASFGGVLSDYQDPNSVVTELGGDKYRVRAWVDSQNSFGAQIRTQFSCEIEERESGSWRCTSLVFSP